MAPEQPEAALTGSGASEQQTSLQLLSWAAKAGVMVKVHKPKMAMIVAIILISLFFIELLCYYCLTKIRLVS